MTRTVLLATTALMAFAGAAQAQTTEQAAQAPVPTGPAQEAPAVDASQQGVLIFQPAFFAELRPNTALDMVSRVPGFQIIDGDGSRGFEGSVGNVLINGSRPASKNDTGSNVLSRTTAVQVERIELIRGGAPGIDMQGFSVVVNVILKATTSVEQVLQTDNVFVDGGRDSFGARYQYTRRNGDRSWGVVLADGLSINDGNGAGRVLRRDANGAVLRDEQYYTDSFGGGQAMRLNYASPLWGGKIDLTGRVGVGDYHQFSEQTSPTVRRDNLFDNDNTTGEFGAVFTRPLGQTMKLETRFIHEFEDFENASVSRTRLNGVDNPEQLFVSDGLSSETIARGLVRWEKSPSLTFEGGAEVAYNMLDTTQAFTIGGTPVPLPSASVKVEETRGELFGKSTWRVRPNLTLEGGLRMEASTISQSGDADQEKTFFFAKPRLLATWTPAPDYQVRARFERELGQLDFGDFAASAELSDENVLGGNVDLEPEQRWISEIAFERRFWKDGIVSLAYRHDEIIDAIDVIPLDNDLSAVGNIGDGTLDQLVANITVPMDRFGFSGGRFIFRNTWNHTEVTDPTTGEIRPISGLRPTQQTWVISQDIQTWKINWSVAYLPKLGQANYDPDFITSWVGRDYFEFVAEYKATPTFSIRAQLNVWDDFNTERTAFAARTNPRPISFVETRAIDPRTFLQIRLRKTF